MKTINAAYNPHQYLGTYSPMSDAPSERTPPPTWIQNGSCHHPLMESDAEYLINNSIEFTEIFKAAILFIISVLIIITNICFIFSINIVTYRSWIPSTTRYLLTSFSSSQLVTGMLITMWGVYPTLTECWPYGELVCQLQAVLRGSLRQQTAFSLVLIALERYTTQVDIDMAKTIFSRPLTVFYIIITWLTSIFIYSFIVFHPRGYYLSIYSFSVCEPYYRSLRMLVLTSCIFYFPTTMLLMYCYGTIYQSERLKMKNRKALFSALPLLIGSTMSNRPIKLSQEADNTASLIRSLSAISLTFIIVVTPWSILQVITSVTMEQPPPSVDFSVNLLFSSFSFLSPFIFWLLNPRMRRTADLALYGLGWCWSAIACCSPGIVQSEHQEPREVQPDDIGEQFWGEILERTYSVNNMNFSEGIHREGNCEKFSMQQVDKGRSGKFLNKS